MFVPIHGIVLTCKKLQVIQNISTLLYNNQVSNHITFQRNQLSNNRDLISDQSFLGFFMALLKKENL